MSGRRLWRLVLGVALGLGLPISAAAQDVVEYYGTDAIGSVRIVFDASGNIVGRMDYGPFGEQLSVSTMGHKSYAGLFRDGDAGLDYAEARSYQVRTGRFSAPDPVYAALFQPQAWNRYSYGFNNPVTFSDPSGLCPDGHYCETVTVTATPTSATPSDPGRTNAWGVVGVGGEGFYAIDLQGIDQADSGGSGGFVMGVIDAILGTEGIGGPDSEQVATPNNNPRTSILTTAAAIFGGVLLSKRLPTLWSTPSKRLLPGLTLDSRQMGSKIGKHARDFGLNPSNPAHRGAMEEHIRSIVGRYDEIRQGPWHPSAGGGTDYLFFRQGADVVVTKASGDFVTVLQGGAGNGWYRRAGGVY